MTPEDIVDALETSDWDDLVFLVDGGRGLRVVPAELDVADRAAALAALPAEATPVQRPDGATEWLWRSEFVRLRLADPDDRKRFGKALRGPGALPRFRRALATRPGVRQAFEAYRRGCLVEWVAREVVG